MHSVDEQPQTWVDGELVDLTAERRLELAGANATSQAEDDPPVVRPGARTLFLGLFALDDPTREIAENLVRSFWWIPFALLLVLGIWLGGRS